MKTIKQKIPPIIVINLLRDVDKKNHIIKILEPLNLPYEFFEAVDGKQLSEAEINKVYDSKTAKKIWGRDLTNGEIGCSLSHIGIYKKMLANNVQQAIILEDDAVITTGFLKLIKQIQHFPNDWGLILLGYNTAEYDFKIKQIKLHNLLNYYLFQSISQFSGTHGYLINQKGAKKLLAANQKIYTSIDTLVGDYKILNHYAVYPKVVKVDSSFPSSIDIIDNRNNNKKILQNMGKKSFEECISYIFDNKFKNEFNLFFDNKLSFKKLNILYKKFNKNQKRIFKTIFKRYIKNNINSIQYHPSVNALSIYYFRYKIKNFFKK